MDWVWLLLWLVLSSGAIGMFTGCCCCKTGMINELFTTSGISSDWEVRSGSWLNPSTNYCETTSTDAVILRTEGMGVLESNGISITVTTRREPVLETKIRVIFGWQDDNNYYAAELISGVDRVFQCGTNCGNWCTGPAAWVRIIQRIGGVESDVASESWYMHAFADETVSPFRIYDWSIVVCYKESTNPAEYNAQVRINGTGLNTAVNPPTTKCHLEPLGRRVGLGTGDTVGETLLFDSFVVNCPATCTFDLPCQCLPLTAPNNVDLTVTGCAGLAGPLIMSKGSTCEWYYTSGLIGGCTYTIQILIAASGGNIVASFFMCEYHWASGLVYFGFGSATLVASVPGDCEASCAISVSMPSSRGCTPGTWVFTMNCTP